MRMRQLLTVQCLFVSFLLEPIGIADAKSLSIGEGNLVFDRAERHGIRIPVFPMFERTYDALSQDAISKTIADLNRDTERFNLMLERHDQELYEAIALNEKIQAAKLFLQILAVGYKLNAKAAELNERAAVERMHAKSPAERSNSSSFQERFQNFNDSLVESIENEGGKHEGILNFYQRSDGAVAVMYQPRSISDSSSNTNSALELEIFYGQPVAGTDDTITEFGVSRMKTAKTVPFKPSAIEIQKEYAIGVFKRTGEVLEEEAVGFVDDIVKSSTWVPARLQYIFLGKKSIPNTAKEVTECMRYIHESSNPKAEFIDILLGNKCSGHVGK